MKLETLDKLDDKMQELDAFNVPLLAEAFAESDRALMLLRILMMCDEKNLIASREQFNQCIADYFDISDEDLDDAKSVYDREGLSDYRREKAS